MLGPVLKAETTLPPGSPKFTREGVRRFIGSLAATNTWTVRIQACLVKKYLYGNKTLKNTFVLIMKS